MVVTTAVFVFHLWVVPEPEIDTFLKKLRYREPPLHAVTTTCAFPNRFSISHLFKILMFRMETNFCSSILSMTSFFPVVDEDFRVTVTDAIAIRGNSAVLRYDGYDVGYERLGTTHKLRPQ